MVAQTPSLFYIWLIEVRNSCLFNEQRRSQASEGQWPSSLDERGLSEFMPRQEQVSLPLAQVSGNIVDSKPQFSSGNPEGNLIFGGLLLWREERLGSGNISKCFTQGRLKPRNSICQLPASCSPGSTMSLLIIFCPLTLCSNLTSPASQACLCAWSVDKSGWRRLSVVLSSLTWEVTDLSLELWLLWLQCLP